MFNVGNAVKCNSRRSDYRHIGIITKVEPEGIEIADSHQKTWINFNLFDVYKIDKSEIRER